MKAALSALAIVFLSWAAPGCEERQEPPVSAPTPDASATAPTPESKAAREKMLTEADVKKLVKSVLAERNVPPVTTWEEVQAVSLIQLISNPNQYKGSYIRVCGFLRLEFEGNGLYLHCEDYEQSLTRNGLWVDVPGSTKKENVDLKYVIIEGTFDPEDKGHMGLWSGAIKDIKRVDLWGSDWEHRKKEPSNK